MYTKEAYTYRGVTFYLFLAWLITAIAGVAYFRNFYYYLTVVAISYGLLKFFYMFFVMAAVLVKYNAAVASYKAHKNSNYICSKKVTHVVIIPNYN